MSLQFSKPNYKQVKKAPFSQNKIEDYLVIHSALMRNLKKVWKTWTGPLWSARAWSRGSKSALSKIIKN